MSFSFCLSKGQVLLLAGFGLLYQTLGLTQNGKPIEDSQRLLCSVIYMLEHMSAPGALEFKKIACAMITIDQFSKGGHANIGNGSRRKSTGKVAAFKNMGKSSRKFSEMTGGPKAQKETFDGRPLGPPSGWLPNTFANGRSNSSQSLSSGLSDPSSKCTLSDRSTSATSTSRLQSLDPPNLDYFDFSNGTGADSDSKHTNTDPTPAKSEFPESTESGPSVSAPSFVEGVFPSPDVFSSQFSTTSPVNIDWTSDLWTMPADMCNQPSNSQSIPSLSEEEAVESEELCASVF